MVSVASQVDADVDAGPVVVDQVQALGDSLLDGVVRDIENELGSIPDQTREAMKDHFWCDLLAHVANILDESIKFVATLPDRIADSVSKSRAIGNRSTIERGFLKVAIKHLLKRMQGLVAGGDVDNGKSALLVVRVLTVLICKQPETHHAVVEYCVDPLSKQFFDTTKKQLLEAFPDWLPNIHAEVVTSG